MTGGDLFSFRPHALGRAEIIHYHDTAAGDFIAQRGARFSYRLGEFSGSFRCPIPPRLRPFALTRPGRRLARLDKGTCVHLPEPGCLFVFYQGQAFSYDLRAQELTPRRRFGFRNPLFMGTAVLDGRAVAFGEYFPNHQGRAADVFLSEDAGTTWQTAYRFDAGQIWHVHGVHHDPFTGNYWICTGDRDGECRIVMVDREFREIARFGDGSQAWRAVSMFFLKDRVLWGMDSPLAPCHVMSLDRATGELSKGQPMPGPVWYAKHLTDGVGVLQTSSEHLGLPGVQSDHAHLFATTDFERWTEIASWPKDRWPNRLMLHAVLSFADGPQTSAGFALSGQAVRGLDGISGLASIDRERLP